MDLENGTLLFIYISYLLLPRPNKQIVMFEQVVTVLGEFLNHTVTLFEA